MKFRQILEVLGLWSCPIELYRFLSVTRHLQDAMRLERARMVQVPPLQTLQLDKSLQNYPRIPQNPRSAQDWQELQILKIMKFRQNLGSSRPL